LKWIAWGDPVASVAEDDIPARHEVTVGV
jgi:hypothetical protein